MTFGEALIASMEEAVAFKRGEITLRTRRVDRTAREVQVAAPPRYDSARIRAIRAKLALSQPVFAAALNVSPQTIKACERGARTPDGPTLRLLEIAEEHPQIFLAKVSGASGKSLVELGAEEEVPDAAAA
jgi:putative transcriptional regulator